MTNLLIDIFAFFVSFAFLNVVFAGIWNVILQNSLWSHCLAESCNEVGESLMQFVFFSNFVAPSLQWYDLWKYHSKPHHEQGFNAFYQITQFCDLKLSFLVNIQLTFLEILC